VGQSNFSDRIDLGQGAARNRTDPPVGMENLVVHDERPSEMLIKPFEDFVHHSDRIQNFRDFAFTGVEPMGGMQMSPR